MFRQGELPPSRYLPPYGGQLLLHVHLPHPVSRAKSSSRNRRLDILGTALATQTQSIPYFFLEKDPCNRWQFPSFPGLPGNPSKELLTLLAEICFREYVNNPQRKLAKAPPSLQTQPSPVLGTWFELPITYLLGVATVLCTHGHCPGAWHSPGPWVEGVGEQDGQVGVVSSVVVVVPRVVDGFPGRAGHWGRNVGGAEQSGQRAGAWLPTTRGLPHFSSLLPTHNPTSTLS